MAIPAAWASLRAPPGDAVMTGRGTSISARWCALAAQEIIGADFCTGIASTSDEHAAGKEARLTPDDLKGRFMAALAACGGSSAAVRADGLADAVAALVGAQARVLVGPGLPSLADDLLARGIDARPGVSGQPGGDVAIPGADAAEAFADAAASATCGITAALLGIAASGTIAVDTREGNAGLLSCLPPHHIAILAERSIEPTLTDALAILAEGASPAGAGFVLISGPSRTSDIEMLSVLGVHGPLRLDVLIVSEEA